MDGQRLWGERKVIGNTFNSIHGKNLVNVIREPLRGESARACRQVRSSWGTTLRRASSFWIRAAPLQTARLCSIWHAQWHHCMLVEIWITRHWAGWGCCHFSRYTATSDQTPSSFFNFVSAAITQLRQGHMWPLSILAWYPRSGCHLLSTPV